MQEISSGLQEHVRSIPKRLLLSYVIDWVIIIAIVAVGGVFSLITGYQRAFALDDPAISLPFSPDTVRISTAAIVALIVPAIIIAVLSLLLVPGSVSGGQVTQKSLVWRRKLWEWNAGWMGLALSFAGAFFLTQGLKDLIGKPRPDFLARCAPDLAKYDSSIVSGYGLSREEAYAFVTASVCSQPNKSVLDDGFASFPSGHSSISWSGLLYLSLWLSSKLSVAVPSLSKHHLRRNVRTTGGESTSTGEAAPPMWLLVIISVPVGVAFYISSTRYSDYHHSGFDIIVGSLIGAFFAWFAFRWYHQPIRAGGGWAWGPRNRNRAFFTGVGVPSYADSGVGGGGHSAAQSGARDLESQHGSGEGILNSPQPNPVSYELQNLAHGRDQSSSQY